MATRRKFLVASAAVASSAYVYHRTLRFPRIGFEHQAPATSATLNDTNFELEQAIVRLGPNTTTDNATEFRAIGPKPLIDIQTAGASTLKFEIGNIAQNALLFVDGEPSVKIDEQINGLRRNVSLATPSAKSLKLSWRVPDDDAIKFAAIGDTGAGLELEWVLDRAPKLGAQFLLHLGDFNYSDGEYDRAIKLFDNAQIPCYVSIGNHDYNKDGLVYQQSLNQLGPMNQAFELAGTRFVNIDTAANFLPASGGQRGRLFDQLEANMDNYTDTVCFTHRPFVDIRAGEDHDISGFGEIEWLSKQIKQCGGNQLLTGHVHKSGEVDFEGIQQWTAGEGLGFDDIVQRKRVAKILLGEISTDAPVQYHWQPLEMPWEMHRSPTHKKKLLKEYSTKELLWYEQMLKANPVI